ncbi:UTRA domain-containing protein [Niveispirillum fermenti]|uniref:UTRA domain-containing protein n=1 Tax=Niveispirillum fermenti TaxID=1233113 RepID=UPI004042A7A3
MASLIGSGALSPGDRVPSEHELVARFQVSRMTANRALRELTAEGWVIRVPGLGSFVAPARQTATMLEIPDMVETALGRGARHRVETITSATKPASSAIALAFGMRAGISLFHGRWRHLADRLPLQVEDRWTLPHLAPDRPAPGTPEPVAPYEQMDHSLRAALPPPDIAGLLALPPQSPCLHLTRRTRLGGQVSTVAEFWMPGDQIILTGISRPKA